MTPLSRIASDYMIAPIGTHESLLITMNLIMVWEPGAEGPRVPYLAVSLLYAMKIWCGHEADNYYRYSRFICPISIRSDTFRHVALHSYQYTTFRPQPSIQHADSHLATHWTFQSHPLLTMYSYTHMKHGL